MYTSICFLFCVFIGLLIPSKAFDLRSSRGFPRKVLSMGVVSASTLKDMSPRRALFFEILQSGLEDRFQADSLPRIEQWLRYTTREIPAPKGYKDFHDPGEEHIDGLTAAEWWDTDKFEWTAPLEETAPLIREELERVLTAEELFKADSNFQQMMGSGWTAFRLQRMGEWNEENMARFPITSKVVKSLKIPLAVRGVMFARQQPGSGVQPHTDGRNFILTCHLGVSVPTPPEGRGKGCWIKVGSERRVWENNKALIFDTSFTHETRNETDEDRYVLIIDFWHPDLSEDEKEALAFIYDARNKYDNGEINKIDCSWVKQGKKPLTPEAYEKKVRGIGASLADLFSNGGLIKNW